MSLAQQLGAAQQVVLPEGGEAERVDRVQLDALVVLKIVKHARENPFEPVSGPLLGQCVCVESGECTRIKFEIRP